MDQYLNSTAPWQFKLALCLFSGLLIVVPILCIPKRWIVYSSRWWFCDPNAITLACIPIFWAGVLVLFRWSPFWGYLIIVFACILDVMDGKVSKTWERAGIVRSRLTGWIGGWLDPFRDKLTVTSLILYFAYLGFVDWRLAVIIAIPEFVGTVSRDPFIMFPALWRTRGQGSLKQRILAELDRRDAAAKLAPPDRNRATPMGKIKALTQCFGLIACFPQFLGWQDVPNIPLPQFLGWADPPRLQSWIFCLAAIFGALNVLSRFSFSENYDHLMERLAVYFKHEDVL